MSAFGHNERLSPGDVLGPYRLERLLGEGAMGRVFRARRHGDDTDLALKVMREALASDVESRRRFLREARSAAEIDHRHLVKFVDTGEVEGRLYLAMVYVPGPTLAAVISASGRMETPKAVRIIAQVGSALGAMHNAGLVHRDVKPSNVLLDEDGAAHLTDFGLAKHPDYSTVTRPGRVLGTLHYLAPELIRGDEATSASDIYALAVVAFECFAGQPPFAGRSAFALGMAHLDDVPPDPVAGRHDVPAEVGTVINQALAKEPERRPPTAVMFANLLLAAARAR